MHGLKIYLDSFTINSNLAYECEEIRVSVTTLPEECKQSVVVKTEDMRNAHTSLTVDITDKTKELVFIFWQRNLVQGDPIIASTVVYAKEIPKSFDDENNNKEYRIGLLEPVNIKKIQFEESLAK